MKATYIGKVESNALWNRLSIEQQHVLETWLFDEGISYREAWQRARVRWSFPGTVASIDRFYRVKRHERKMAASFAEKKNRVTAPFEAFGHLFDGPFVSRIPTSRK